MKIGILTGGGDVPGLNAFIKAVVYRAVDEGHTVVGIRRGWNGLLNYNREDDESIGEWTRPLEKRDVRTIDRTGGTFLHTSRLHPGKVNAKEVPRFLREPDWDPLADDLQDFTAHILKNLEHLEIDVLIPIGGDDTLNYAHRLHKENVPLVAVPKTMDNDVYGTDYCIGFSTAITRCVNVVHSLRTSIGSYERLGVIELFGRHSGETSLISAYLADVDRTVISEVPFDPERLAQLLMEDKRHNPSNYAIMTISEGATMIGRQRIKHDYSHKPIGAVTRDALKTITGERVVYQQVGYLMRSGVPDSIDLMVGLNFANMAMDLIGEKTFGQMVALKAGKYTTVPVDVLSEGIKRVDVDELYDVDSYRPKVRHVNQKPMFLY